MALTFYRPPFISRWLARRSASNPWLVRNADRLPPWPVLDRAPEEAPVFVVANENHVQVVCKCDAGNTVSFPLILAVAYLVLFVALTSLSAHMALAEYPSEFAIWMGALALLSLLLAFLPAYALAIALRQLRSYIRMRRGKRPPHTVTFDRRNQTVSLPPVGEGEYIEVPWQELQVIPEYSPGSYGGHFGGFSALRPDNHLSVPLGRLQEEWDFYCWYMDPRKPLPPGRVFDPYRKRDDERRAREYGPEVLRRYPSAFTDGSLEPVGRRRQGGYSS